MLLRDEAWLAISHDDQRPAESAAVGGDEDGVPAWQLELFFILFHL